MPSLFRRTPGKSDTDLVTNAVSSVADADEPSVAGATSKAYTPGKGRATPKRSQATPGSRKVAEAPPKTRREAFKRMRERQRVERIEARAGMLAGKEENLLPRDRGPEKRLVRNIVDTRRNVGTWFFLGALIVIVGSSQAMPPAVRAGANIFWILLALAVIFDSVLLCRKVKRVVLERFPKTEVSMRKLYMYAVMRAITFRRIRMPNPQLKIGQPY